MKVYYLVVVTWKLFTHIIATIQDTVWSLSIYIKQFLNEVKKFNKLLKLLTNDKNKNPRWIS